MAKDTNISWTDHTFNPLRGCTKVSQGCKHCYAEELAKRNPKTLGVWGTEGTRVVAAAAAWREPLRWNAAAAAKRPAFVFCGSLCDVFEHDSTIPEGARDGVWWARGELVRLMAVTPWLTWLLLTKRPENIKPVLAEMGERYRSGWYAKRASAVAVGQKNKAVLDSLLDWARGNAPRNVWLGASVEDQGNAEKRIPHLQDALAVRRFLSCEPLLGPVNLERWLGGTSKIDWVIVGGESGAKRRAFDPAWAHSLRRQCERDGVAFWFKQHDGLRSGERPYLIGEDGRPVVLQQRPPAFVPGGEEVEP